MKEVKEKSIRKFKGRLDSLEDFLNPEWWKYIFDSVYLKTDADVVMDDEITEKEVDIFLEILKPNKDDKILDLACGQGRHSIEFYKRGYREIEGVDISEYLIRKAKQRAKKENLKIRFRKADARNLPYKESTFDFVLILGNSFGYFSNASDDYKVLKEVFKVLKPYGVLLLDIADGDYVRNHYKPYTWEWINDKYVVLRERQLSHDKRLLISREIVIHANKGVIVDQIYSERLYSQSEIEQILRSVGFTDIKFHTNLIVQSKRNIDLGLMENRIILTAVAPKESVRVSSKVKTFNITVVLGDTSLKSHIEYELEAIKQLKIALSKLQGYKFSYIENHKSLFYDLGNLKTDLVFNLCDDGYNNKANMELHIPALLEVLNIPYTGSPPHTLAICYDKSLVKSIANSLNIPTPDEYLIMPDDTTYNIPTNFPVILKPNFGDGSEGIYKDSVVYDPIEFTEVLNKLRKQFPDVPILVEEFLTGDEISIGILGNLPYDFEILPILKIDYSELPEDLPPICGYEAKWDFDSIYYKKIKYVPAELDKDIEEKLYDMVLKLYSRLDLRDYGRFDIRFSTDGIPKLLEVNPNPGWSWDGKLKMMCEWKGIEYEEMLERIIRYALKRYNLL
ncbi:MAG: methyltransferase domain-containing protein [candidate division WOR-3 bacterium]|jgi:D-alanine-D-alanine ligase